jgi:hypothetical protein
MAAPHSTAAGCSDDACRSRPSPPHSGSAPPEPPSNPPSERTVPVLRRDGRPSPWSPAGAARSLPRRSPPRPAWPERPAQPELPTPPRRLVPLPHSGRWEDPPPLSPRGQSPGTRAPQAEPGPSSSESGGNVWESNPPRTRECPAEDLKSSEPTRTHAFPLKIEELALRGEGMRKGIGCQLMEPVLMEPVLRAREDLVPLARVLLVTGDPGPGRYPRRRAVTSTSMCAPLGSALTATADRTG